MSLVTGESLAWLEDFLALEALGGGGNPLEWPARRVDAFVVLKAEMEKTHAES